MYKLCITRWITCTTSLIKKGGSLKPHPPNPLPTKAKKIAFSILEKARLFPSVMGGGGETRRIKLNILKIKNNYNKVEMNFNVNYGKSQTDKTHFKPNVNVWDDLQGANNNVGMYDNDYETGKLRSIITNPSLDRAEVDEYMKNEYEKSIKDVREEKTKMIEELMKQKEQETQENKETQTTNTQINE